MSKIGFIYTSYNNYEYLMPSLKPLIDAKEDRVGGNEFIISAVSLPFEEYKDIAPKDDKTSLILNKLIMSEKIDYLTTNPEYIKEHDARTLAANPLLLDNCDFLWLVDGDEFLSVKEIENTIKFIQKESFVDWFRLCYKNYVFDENHYLADSFTPPRIYRANKQYGCKFKGFNWDNDAYWDESDHRFYQKELASMTVPKNIFNAKHYTWLSNENSKRKILYQNLHFQHGAGCAFRWDEKIGLTWNNEYFLKTGLPIPEILEE